MTNLVSLVSVIVDILTFQWTEVAKLILNTAINTEEEYIYYKLLNYLNCISLMN